MQMNCPCCDAPVEREILLVKTSVPALNNRVYTSAADAIAALSGNIDIQICGYCNYAFNADFEPELADYENGYDATRSDSRIYSDHEIEVAAWCAPGLDQRHHVLEIGCGNGSFLEALCDRTKAAGTGFDPGAPANRSEKLFEIRRERFTRVAAGEKPFDMVILRHVMEHIPEPSRFLTDLLDNDTLAADGKLIIEVPDLDWILENQSVFDITYEHCGYFSRPALHAFLESIGFSESRFYRPFGGQYLLMEARPSKSIISENNHRASERSTAIQKLNDIRNMWPSKLAEFEKIAVWGASGKGVIFLSDLDEVTLRKIMFMVDINSNKHNKYIPVTGKIIMPPNHLKSCENIDVIIVMNPVYANEIRAHLEFLNVRTEILTAQELTS